MARAPQIFTGTLPAPIGTAIIGPIPGDLFITTTGGVKLYAAVAIGTTDTSGNPYVQLVDAFSLSGNGGSGGSSTLAGDTDVAISEPADGDLLTFSESAGKWTNQPNPAPSFASSPYVAYISGGTSGLTAVGDYPDTFGAVSLSSEPVSDTIGANACECFTFSQPSAAGFYSDQARYRVGRNPKMHVAANLSSTSSALVWIGFNNLANSGVASESVPNAFSGGGGCAAFRFSTSSGDTTWQACVAGNGMADQIIDTGVTADTNTHRFAIIFDDNNGKILFYIDGNLVAAATTGTFNNPNLRVYLSTYQTAGQFPILYFGVVQVQVDW